MNEKKGKSQCSDGERILKFDYFIAGKSNPVVVTLATQAYVIFIIKECLHPPSWYPHSAAIFLSIRIILNCFYLLTFYFEKFST